VENARLRSLALQLLDACFPTSNVATSSLTASAGASSFASAAAPTAAVRGVPSSTASTTHSLSALSAAGAASAVPASSCASCVGSKSKTVGLVVASAKETKSSSSRQESKDVVPASLSSKIKGKWIVLLKSDAKSPATFSAAGAGGPDFSLKCVAHRVSNFFRSFSDIAIGHVSSFAHKAFGATIPEDRISAVLNHEDVLRIERDETMSVQLYDCQSNQYNLKLLPPSRPGAAGGGASATGGAKSAVTASTYATVLDKMRAQSSSDTGAGAGAGTGAGAGETKFATAAFQAQGNDQTVPWGVVDVNAPNSSRAKNAGKAVIIGNVDVFIVDTGVFQGHPDLNLVESVNFSNDRTPSDLNGHGTHVAGTVGATDNTAGVVGVAPGVRLHSVKVLDQNGSGGMSNVLAGVDYVVGWKRKNPSAAVVANLSVGFYSGSTAYNAIDEAIENAISQGVMFVIAAGNDGRDAAMASPSHVRSAITVGAYGQGEGLSRFSNRGSTVTVNAPGENILSTWKGNSYARLNGTSMATPHVAGLAALYLSVNQRATPAQIKQGVISMARSGLVKGAPQGTTTLAAYNRVYDA
jgi:subtilisin